MKTDLFQSCGHCWVFQICWHIECSTFTASSFRIWNSSTGIPSPLLALFIVMLLKASLTSHSRMCGSRWMITSSWLSGSWRSLLYSSSVYSCHLFLILLLLLGPDHFCPLLCPSLLYWLHQSLWLCGSNKLWKILKEMGIPDHLTCLMRNLYAGQEATGRIGHGTMEWFQIRRGVCQGCILSRCLFNLYAEFNMQNAVLDEAQAAIKIAGRNINNLI